MKLTNKQEDFIIESGMEDLQDARFEAAEQRAIEDGSIEYE